MESIRLMTLSECEIQGRQPGFLAKLLDQEAPTTQDIRVREHLVKTPKLHSVDTGMMCAVRGLNRERLLKQPGDFGLVLESIVYNELRKQAVWIEEPLNFYHYRDKDKVEVDVIIENAMGDCFAIEVKAAATLSTKDFTGLKRFQSVAGDRFKIGVLLYDGDHTTAFGDNLYAALL